MSKGGGADCLVIGGGVIGLSTALSLRRAGAEVTVLEREQHCGQETSAAAAGMLAAAVEAGSPGPFFDICRRSNALWEDWAALLFELSGVDCELERSGLLRVVMSAEAATGLEVRRAWQLTQGIEVSELLSLDLLRREVPGLGPKVVAGLLYPSEGHVHTHRVTEALAASCLHLGVKIELGARVVDLGPLRPRPTVLVDGPGVGEFSAQHVVLAAGPWSAPFLRKLGVVVSVEPVRGQVLAVSPPGPVLSRIVFGDHGYLLQKRSGLVLVGASEEPVGFQPWPTMGGVGQLTQVAQSLLPSLATARFSHSWAGLRPYARGGPLLGRSPVSAQVLLATGHHRNGILLAPVTGELIAEAVVSGSDPVGLQPFAPGRPD